ncbi:hypothetical protein [Bradyrhizobium liaoningense]|uniref:hypothetical protein n=1 Tax=Bradyrhizobium liaoningense TaxID=43992 RepID=UPI0020137530|nr:hypothetical protein [Bradyrhizobium liaoningense]
MAPFIGPTWDACRCAEGPVYNFYHGAYYGAEPPALDRARLPAVLPLQRLSQAAAQIFLRHGLALLRGHDRRQMMYSSVPLFHFEQKEPPVAVRIHEPGLAKFHSEPVFEPGFWPLARDRQRLFHAGHREIIKR